jgi:hypothetical protein
MTMTALGQQLTSAPRIGCVCSTPISGRLNALAGDRKGPATAYNTLREFALGQARVPEASRRSLSIKPVEL